MTEPEWKALIDSVYPPKGTGSDPEGKAEDWQFHRCIRSGFLELRWLDGDAVLLDCSARQGYPNPDALRSPYIDTAWRFRVLSTDGQRPSEYSTVMESGIEAVMQFEYITKNSFLTLAFLAKL